MRLSPLALLTLVSPMLLAACDRLTGSNETVSISGTVSCYDGRAVTQGHVAIYRGKPYSNCLVPCFPSGAPVLVQEGLGAEGRFALSLDLKGGDDAGDLWILASASGDSVCGAGYNFVDQPLPPVEHGTRIHGLALVIYPFVS